MEKAHVLILGHSFICRLRDHITCSQDNEYTAKLGISMPDFICKWHGVGSQTIAKVLKYDLSVVKDFGPDIIILQLRTNDLVDSSPIAVGSSLEDLLTLLHDVYKTLTKYLKIVLEPIPYTFFWSHQGFWKTKSTFLSQDGVHLNGRGQHKLYLSLRGQCSNACIYLMNFI